MIFTRTLGKILMGKPTLTQLGLTCVLATIWGFLPGMDVAPLSILIMLGLLLVLKANLALALLVASLAHLIALLFLPITFKLGVFLVEGPLGGVFGTLINGSGTALMGFDYYVTAGSWTMGLVLGLAGAWFLTGRVRELRNLLSGLEKDSERYQKTTAKGWVKFMGWLLLGVNISEMEPRFEEKGGPFRIAGIVVVVLFIATLFFATPFIEAYAAKQMKSGLERANGATVDVTAMALSFAESSLILEGLAMADPEKLTHDRFRAERVEVNLSVRDLFAKRVVLNLVEATGGEMNVKRAQKGQRFDMGTEEREPIKLEVPEYEDLETYWKQAKEMKARLRKLRRFLEDMSGQLPESDEQGAHSFEEWLLDEIAQKGYNYVRALHKIKGTPAFLVRQFKAHDVKNGYLPEELLNLDAHNLSTHPHIIGEPVSLGIISSAKTLEISISLNEASSTKQPSQIKMAYRNIPMERLTAQLKETADYLHGGTVDCSLDGEFKVAGGSYIQLPLQVRLNGVTLQLPKVQPVILNDFPIMVLLKGPLDNPRIKFDHKAFIKSLREKGFDAVIDSYKQQIKVEVNERIDEEKENLVDSAKEKLNDELGDKLNDQMGDQIDSLFKGKKDKPTQADDTPEEKETPPPN